MAVAEKEPKPVDKSVGGKPLQLTTYAEKIADDNSWGKQTMDYFINKANFGVIRGANKTDPNALCNKQDLFNAYNNQIPEALFNYVTNPTGGKDIDEKYLNFPSKIRSYNIIRPSIDLLIGEWNKRPFFFDVVNADGDDAQNAFLEYQTKTFQDNLVQRFVNTANELTKNSTGVPTEEIPDPKTVITELNGNYKDAKALNGYKALKVMELEIKLREKWRMLIKDWFIGGEVASIKMPLHGDIDYKKLSILGVDGDESCFSPYLEDGEYATALFKVSTSELVDLFYDKLKEKDLKELDSASGVSFGSKLFNNFNSLLKNEGDKHDLYYCTWKTKVKRGYLSYPDPVTGQEQNDIVDEDYVADPEAGESIEWLWLNEVWHGWRINDKKYIGIEPVQGQRNEMNNFSACKLTINGKKFSNTESNNVSVVSLGMPYQILYIILMYRLELTIAKSKGKIVLMDKEVIPDEDDGGEAGFFWYAEAMGFALIDPSQGHPGYNQYTVLDMSLYQHISELINIIDFVKRQWDELIGITGPRKGQNTTEGLGTNEQSIFRSSVVSDLLFTGFEEFLETELTGLLDISKYAWIDGKKGQWRNDEGRLEMFSIEGEDYANSQYGVFVQNMSALMDKFNMLKGQINAIAQRKDVKTSTIIDVAFTDSLTELKALVKKAEAAEVAIQQKIAENQAQAEKDKIATQQEYAKFLKYLDAEIMHQEYDRKDNEIYIQGEVDQAIAGGQAIDPAAIEAESNKRLDRLETSRIEREKLNVEKGWQEIERENIKSKERIAKENNKTKLKNKVSGEK